MFWVYDLPNWVFGLLCISAFMLFGVAGLYGTRKWVRAIHEKDHSHNDIVRYYLAAVTVFYGITLGLVTVGTWNSYSAVKAKVDIEAQVVASLFRDVNGYPEPARSALRDDLRAYTRQVIDVSWPEQRRGVVPTGSGVMIDSFADHIVAFEPKTAGQQILHAESFKQFNNLVEARRSRLDSVTASIPTALWMLVILGALISITVTLFFDTPSFNMHLWMTILMSGLLGLLIFLVGTLDNPFRGKVSVGPQALERLYQQLMK